MWVGGGHDAHRHLGHLRVDWGGVCVGGGGWEGEVWVWVGGRHDAYYHLGHLLGVIGVVERCGARVWCSDGGFLRGTPWFTVVDRIPLVVAEQATPRVRSWYVWTEMRAEALWRLLLACQLWLRG